MAPQQPGLPRTAPHDDSRMRSLVYTHLSDDELFAEIVRARAEGRNVERALGELVERWRKSACYIIRKVQASYRISSPEDERELFQEAVGKLVDRGLDQFRGISVQVPGKAASPRTFFLRIAKHVAIDRYRRQREVLASRPDGGEDDAPESSPHEIAQAIQHSRRTEERADASEVYWAAFERLRREHPNEAGAWDLYHHQDVEDHEECARRLGITVTNSYKRVSRAQAYLRLYLLEMQEKEGS